MRLNFKIPYLPELSKNRMKGFRNGRYFTSAAYKKACEKMILLIRAKMKREKVEFREDRVLIRLLLNKPRPNIDVVNFVSSWCDIIKTAISVDDRYFWLIANWKEDKREKAYFEVEIIQN